METHRKFKSYLGSFIGEHMKNELPSLTDDQREMFIDKAINMSKRIRRQEKKNYERRNKIEVLTGEWITEEELQRRLRAATGKHA